MLLACVKAKAGPDYSKLEEEIVFKPGLELRKVVKAFATGQMEAFIKAEGKKHRNGMSQVEIMPKGRYEGTEKPPVKITFGAFSFRSEVPHHSGRAQRRSPQVVLPDSRFARCQV